MKLGWLVWLFDVDVNPILITYADEPDYCYRKVLIVYTEVKAPDEQPS